MSWAVFRSTLQIRRTSLLWYSFGLALYGWFIVAFFPLIEDNMQYMEIFETVFTEEMMAIFGAAGLNFGTFGGFVTVEYLGLIWVFIVAAAVITFAAGSLGGAVEDGTMELTLAQPVSRMQVALMRYLALAAYAGILNFVTVATIYLPGLLHGVDVPLDGMGLLFAIGWVVTMAIGGFAYAVSAFSSGGGRTIGISLGVLAAMWLADVLGNISERFDWLSEFTLFNYWKPDVVIDDLTVAGESWAVFGITALVTFVIAVWAFRRRDVV
ncbi:MAG: ABC transporter permease subunit [Anaerosomatales bacterium]|nr:ABC transporter permease subunit [Anaerosomatales bacterium]